MIHRLPLSTLLLFMVLLWGCGLLRPLPDKSSTQDRLNAFPTVDLPLEKNVRISWNEYLVPFVEAQTDKDAAFALGLVHAHLRLAQMEIYRKVAQGRISEMAGPWTIDIDHTIRLLGLSKALDQIEKQLPTNTRNWLENFVSGINHYKDAVPQRPYEFGALNIQEEPWAVHDILLLARMAAADVNWFILFRFLRLRHEPGFSDLWTRYLALKASSFTQNTNPKHPDLLPALLLGFSKTGSNSVVISGKNSQSRHALIANDPHLGLSIPNLWLIAGYRCPSYHVVGLMIPGLPFVALGRNSHIAWGGTNMRAWSSDLYDISHFSEASIATHPQTIGVRLWPDKDIDLPSTHLGPLLSDSPMFEKQNRKEKLALRWMGHFPSDEITALLAVNRAQNWRHFTDAFQTYAVSGQNFLYADIQGNIGQFSAVRLPRRKDFPTAKMMMNAKFPQADWNKFWTPYDFPRSLNPKEGYLASANNQPLNNKRPIGAFFSPNDRSNRMRKELSKHSNWNIQKLTTLQKDTYSETSVFLRDLFCSLLNPAAKPNWQNWLRPLQAWDGYFRKHEKGPVVLQLLLYHYLQEAYKHRTSEKLFSFLLGSDAGTQFAIDDLSHPKKETLRHLEKAAAATTRSHRQFETWGQMHRLQLAHPLANLPLIGKRFVFLNLAVGGSSETLAKTAHKITDEVHNTRYGAQARHISDLSHPDKNFFVLLGGQDGWLKSEHFLDQLPLWLSTKMIQVPLKSETIRKTFTHQMDLKAAKAD